MGYGGVVVEQCKGCEKIVDLLSDESHCTVWNSPATRWRIGICPNATHVHVEIKTEKKRIGQQKQKKKK